MRAALVFISAGDDAVDLAVDEGVEAGDDDGGDEDVAVTVVAGADDRLAVGLGDDVEGGDGVAVPAEGEDLGGAVVGVEVDAVPAGDLARVVDAGAGDRSSGRFGCASTRRSAR
jgi:hypothetical protein